MTVSTNSALSGIVDSALVQNVLSANQRKTGLKRLTGGSALYSTGSSGGSTFFHGIEAEAPFSAVQLLVLSREPMNVSSGWQFCVASTEVTTFDTATNAFIPQVTPPTGFPGAGVRTQYNNYVANATANIFGWRRGTWGLSNASGILYPGTDQMPPTLGIGDTYSTVGSILVSDTIECKSVPPASGVRPMLLMRLTHPATTGETHSWFNTFATQSTDGNYLLYAWDLARQNGEAFGRRFYTQELGSTDGVNTLTNMPGSVLSFASNNSNNFGSPMYAIKFYYDVPVTSVLGLGDSVMENGGYQKYGFDSWLTRAVLSKSAPSAPYEVANSGLSTNTTANFYEQLTAYLQAGVRPTKVVGPNWSINDRAAIAGGAPTLATTNAVKARILKCLDLCKAVGAQFYIYTHIYNWNAGTAAEYGALADLDAWTRNLCSSGAATLVDNSGYNIATMTGPDNTHPNQLGIAYLQSVLQAVI